jgi:hypothetical protein
MARARNIKPGFFTNADLIECQPLARLLFAGLWCEADRRGILEDRPKTLKIKILPGDNCDVDDLLNELMSRRFIQRYEADGIRCILILNFPKHQNPHRDEKVNTLPAPYQHCAGRVSTPEQHGSSTVVARPHPSSLIPITENGQPHQPRVPAREKPPSSLYAKTLNGALPTLESMFQRIDQLFTPGWLAKELADAEAVVGSLSKEQLGRGLDIAVKQIERQMAAKAVRNPRPFAHKLIVDYLTEQREGNHAT